MKTFFYYLEIIFTVLIGICGLTLFIGGICINSILPIIIGSLGIIFSIVVPRLKRNTLKMEKNTKLDYISNYVSLLDSLLFLAQKNLLIKTEFEDNYGTIYKNVLRQLEYYDERLATSLKDIFNEVLDNNLVHREQFELS